MIKKKQNPKGMMLMVGQNINHQKNPGGMTFKLPISYPRQFRWAYLGIHNQ
jgi:hypothetical protein